MLRSCGFGGAIRHRRHAYAGHELLRNNCRVLTALIPSTPDRWRYLTQAEEVAQSRTPHGPGGRTDVGGSGGAGWMAPRGWRMNERTKPMVPAARGRDVGRPGARRGLRRGDGQLRQ